MSNTPKSLWTTILAIRLVAGGLVTLRCNQYAPHDKTISGKLRIVSLAPSVTEVLFGLGVGITASGLHRPIRLSPGVFVSTWGLA